MLLMLAVIPARAQTWVKVDEGIEYDSRSVRVAGSLRQVMVQVTLPFPDPTPKSTRRLFALYEIDCKESRFRTLALELTAKEAAAAVGKAAAEPWARISSAHEGEAMLRKAVCAGRS